MNNKLNYPFRGAAGVFSAEIDPYEDKITVEQYHKLVKKKPKYGNRKTETARGTFDSKLEAEYEEQLFLRHKAGEFKYYMSQVRIPLVVNKILICDYIIDFYIRHLNGSTELVEVKGKETKDWRIKWKLLQAIYGIEYKYTLVKKV